LNFANIWSRRYCVVRVSKLMYTEEKWRHEWLLPSV